MKKRKKKCWAEIRALMLQGRAGYDKDDPFKPTFHADKLESTLHWRKPVRIDCCFMGDISCANPFWIEKVLDVIKQTPRHRYYILTKNPVVLQNYKFPKNAWVGVTVNKNKNLWRIAHLKKIHARIKFISIEPLYERLSNLPKYLDSINWIIIGAQTRPELQPRKDWVREIIEAARKQNIPVFMKDNLKYPSKLTEFPEEFNEHL